MDEDVARVVHFMETGVAAERLQYVASCLPAVAALVWSSNRCATVYREPINGSQSNANESVLADTYAGGGSAAVADVVSQK